MAARSLTGLTIGCFSTRSVYTADLQYIVFGKHRAAIERRALRVCVFKVSILPNIVITLDIVINMLISIFGD